MNFLLRCMGSRAALACVVAACATGGVTTACSKGAAGGGTVVGNGAVPITVDDSGFKPSSVKFVKGAPASLVFTRTTDDTCATAVDFPQLGIKKELPKGTPVTIVIPTDKEQELSFQCGMGMYKSSVVIAAK